MQLTLLKPVFLRSETFSNWLGVAPSRSSRSEVFIKKGALKICSKFTGEHPRWSVISSNSIESTLRHGRSPVHLLHIFIIPLLKNTSGRLLLDHRNFLSCSSYITTWSESTSDISLQHPGMKQVLILSFIVLLCVFFASTDIVCSKFLFNEVLAFLSFALVIISLQVCYVSHVTYVIDCLKYF